RRAPSRRWRHTFPGLRSSRQVTLAAGQGTHVAQGTAGEREPVRIVTRQPLDEELLRQEQLSVAAGDGVRELMHFAAHVEHGRERVDVDGVAEEVEVRAAAVR